jgi:hypothetical protein
MRTITLTVEIGPYDMTQDEFDQSPLDDGEMVDLWLDGIGRYVQPVTGTVIEVHDKGRW